MNLRTKLSLTLNALLLGFVVWLACAEPRLEVRADLSHSLTKRGLRVKSQPTPPSLTREPFPEVVVVSEHGSPSAEKDDRLRGRIITIVVKACK